VELVGILKNKTRGEELPVLGLYPKDWKNRTVVWLSEDGKDGLRNDNGLKGGVKRLLEAGYAVVGIDLLYQGELAPGGQLVKTTRRVKNTRESAAYTFGYNHTLFAQRVHDVLSLISFIQNHERKSESIDIVALDNTGPIAAVARAQSGGAIRKLAMDDADFRFGNLKEIHDVNFLPGSAKYGDLPGFIALGAPGETRLVGQDSVPELAQRIYKSAGAEKAISATKASPEEVSAWILQ
jgi:hypothetical protein